MKKTRPLNETEDEVRNLEHTNNSIKLAQIWKEMKLGEEVDIGQHILREGFWSEELKREVKTWG